MLVKNASCRLISIGGVNIAPEAQGKIDDSFLSNPAIKKYLKTKELVEIEAVEEAASEKGLEKMTKEQLIGYAAENNIDIVGAKTRADILNVIKAAEEVTEEAAGEEETESPEE